MTKFVKVHRSAQRRSLSKAYAVAAAINEIPSYTLIVGYEVDYSDDGQHYVVDVIYES